MSALSMSSSATGCGGGFGPSAEGWRAVDRRCKEFVVRERVRVVDSAVASRFPSGESRA